MRRRWWLLIPVFLLVLGGVWFWSLGSLPDEETRAIVLSSVEGQVSVKEPASADYVVVKEGAVVTQGSSVRTASDGKATVSWYGSGESRIGPDSTVTILQAEDKGDEGLGLRLRLESGRIWSRVMRLLDADADMTVETSDVVATVRGTSFDLEKKPAQPTTLWVADSVVEASGANVAASQDGFFVPEGSMATFGGSERTGSVRPLTDADRMTDWFTRNREADTAFRKNLTARLTKSLAADTAATSGWLRDLSDASENLRQRVVPAAMRDRMDARLLLRRLVVVRRTIEEGKSGLGYQDFARLDAELKARLAGGSGAVAAARPAVMMAQVLYRDVLPGEPAYRIKQQFEEWLPLVARTPGERVFARLLTIDARLDEGVAEADLVSYDQASQMVILARQGLANVEREMRETKDIDPIRRVRLRRLWKALSVRAEALDARLKTATAPPPALPVLLIEAPTSTTAVTSTTPAPVVTSTAPVAPTAPPKPVSIQIQPAQSAIKFSETVSFRVILVYDTGLTRDVTKSARFTMSPTGYGALNGAIFTSTQLQGTVLFTGIYEEGGQTLQGNASVTITR